MAYVDTALMKQIFYVPKRQRKTHIHHNGQLDDLAGCLEVSEKVLRLTATLADYCNRAFP